MELDNPSSITNESLIMFLDYRKPTIDLVVDLINRDNPDLPFPIVANECFLGTPVAWSAAGNFRNTEINVTPRSNSPYIGGFKVRYRRLALSSLFTDAVWFDEWIVQNNISPAEFLPVWNRRTGMSLVPKDISNTVISVYPFSNTTSLIIAAATNLAFIGNTTLRFTPKYPVDLHVPAVITPLFHWDGVPRNEADPLRRYTTYGHDFSAFSDYLETWNTGSPKTLATTDLDLLNLVEYIATITGLPFDMGPETTPYGLLSAFGLRYVLPSSAGFFNSDDFNRCVLIYRSSKLTNVPDVLYLHYKV